MANFAVVELLGMIVLLLCCLTVLVSAGSKIREDEIKVSEFDVKPGGEKHEYQESWDGVTCKFTYASQGGTKEKWSFGMSRSSDLNQYSCSVERPGGTSYLFFLNFKLEVIGGTVWDGEAFGNREKPLKPDEFTVDQEKNMIASKEGGFGAELSRVNVYANAGKSEL
ncbi:myeloid-derived growth factor-like [Liolophura sinensis]|uniref:myeloid-derived growth factor-like n=1 Tax=Liolophura sinensis TaxID=3198878 RepID=UPI003158F993